MNLLRPFVPPWVSMPVPEPIGFDTMDDLLALDCVAWYARSSERRGTFSHFAMRGEMLMAVWANGFRWWPVGSIADPAGIAFPAWDGPKYLGRLPDGREAELTDREVSGYFSDRLVLHDGSLLINVLEEPWVAKARADDEKRDRGICPTCDLAFVRTEVQESRWRVRVSQRCERCGVRIISGYQPGAGVRAFRKRRAGRP